MVAKAMPPNFQLNLLHSTCIYSVSMNGVYIFCNNVSRIMENSLRFRLVFSSSSGKMVFSFCIDTMRIKVNRSSFEPRPHTLEKAWQNEINEKSLTENYVQFTINFIYTYLQCWRCVKSAVRKKKIAAKSEG